MRKTFAATITAAAAVLALSACSGWPGQKAADADAAAETGTPAPSQPVTQQNNAPANAAEQGAGGRAGRGEGVEGRSRCRA